MKTRHTPGPWKATKDPHGHRDDYCIGMETDVARIDRVAVCSECDASLIAAAPELLEAVDRMLTWNHGGQRAEDVVFARRAYAKALGMTANDAVQGREPVLSAERPSGTEGSTP